MPSHAATTTPREHTPATAPQRRAASTPTMAAAVGNRALARAVLARCSCGGSHAGAEPCEACAKDEQVLGRAVSELDGLGAREMARTMQRS